MRLYDWDIAPNPRRVRIFAAEKGIALEIVPVDLRGGGQFEDSFRAVNPRCAVPVLQLDDGTRITESVAICRYLEETHPEPPLMGTGALEKAVVEMWHRRIEIGRVYTSDAADDLRCGEHGELRLSRQKNMPS